jgi:four helix bundle protein
LKLEILRIMKNITELDVYKLAEELSDLIWNDFDAWDKKVQNTVGYQIIRASDSIAANIAEGYGRFTPPDRKKFYLYSRGSFEETMAWLRKLIRRKVINGAQTLKYKIIIEKLGPKLNAFINTTKISELENKK